MRFRLSPVASLLLPIVLIGCLSEEEIADRRKDAFDLSGAWLDPATEAGTLQLTVVNEQGKYDVRVTARRPYLSTAETALLAQHGIPLPALTQAAASGQVLGAGFSAQVGEVQSDDGGATSELEVQGPAQTFGDRSLRYRLRATIAKNDFVLRGTLTAEVTWQAPVRHEDGSEGTTSQTDKAVAATFEASTGATLQGQYLGAWSGQVASPPTVTGAPVRLDLVAEGTSFRVLPTPAAVTYLGQTFTPLPELQPMTDLDATWPTIHLRYASPIGAQLVLVASVFTLGQLDGALVHLGSPADTVLATFRFAKQ